ncbi:transcription factor Opi1-domain-containing protein [Flagelloscypha sp. PMI_526]|nr:transcription factor Opi1-domain-containing protein [Flagelloscypha sp. PMI_526]
MGPPQRAATEEELDEQERIAIAVRALDDMKNSGSPIASFPPSGSAFSSVPTSPSTIRPDDLELDEGEETETQEPSHPQGAVARTLQLPIVNSAINLYEQGRERSRVVQYASSLASRSLSTLSSHVPTGVTKGAVAVDQLVGQRWEKLQPSTSSASPSSTSGSGSASSSNTALPPLSPTSPIQSASEDETNDTPGTSTALQQRSRLQSLFLEAGGLSAALSDESLKRLKYVLSWLMYATAHIDAQIVVLRDFITGLGPDPSKKKATKAQLKTLAGVRSDLVKTVKQAVAVVSQYAGGAGVLNEDARGRVRGFVLGLPSRWARAAKEGGATPSSAPTPVPTAVGSTTSTDGKPARVAHRRAHNANTPYASHSRATSSTTGSRTSSRRNSISSVPGDDEETEEDLGHTALAAQRVLSLATESLDMMRGVTGVVKEGLGRADAWVERFRAVGLKPPSSADAEEEPIELDGVLGVDPGTADSSPFVGLKGLPPLPERFAGMSLEEKDKAKMDVDS